MNTTSKEMNETTALTCEQLERFIVDYLDSKLPAVQQREFEEHLSHCPACEGYLANYRSSIKLSQAAFKEESDSRCETMPEALVQAILASREKNS